MMRCKNLDLHQRSQECKNGMKRIRNVKLLKEQSIGNDVKFYVKGKEIEKVHAFTYLGRTLYDNDDDSPCIEQNIRKARSRWNRLAKILKREGADAIIMSRFYMTVVQAVLLYGADSWVVKDRDMKKLRSFHRRAMRYMTGEHIRKKGEDEWEYPKHELLYKKCRLFPIDVYLERRRGTLREYLMENRSILLDLASNTEKDGRNVNKKLWWEQSWLPKKDMQDLNNLWFPK